MTEGFEVLVQLVIAAMVTAPWASVLVSPFISTGAVRARSSGPRPKPRSFTGATRDLRNDSFIAFKGTRSWGRLGPASDGSTVERSNSMLSVKTGSGESFVRKSPCSFM